MIRIIEANTGRDFQRARTLFNEYVRALAIDLTFQSYEQELANIESIYGPPSGALLLARHKGSLIGCVGLRRLDETTCEMKRLYVIPAARGKGVGRILCKRIIEKAEELGYRRMRLDTLRSMNAARALYGSFGFREIEPYYHNPIPGTVYMEVELK